MLPGGVEEYLTRHRRLVDERDRLSVQAAGPSAASRTSDAGGQRAAAKDLARLDRQLARLSGREARLHEQMAMHASDYQKLVEFERELHELHAERDALEAGLVGGRRALGDVVVEGSDERPKQICEPPTVRLRQVAEQLALAGDEPVEGGVDDAEAARRRAGPGRRADHRGREAGSRNLAPPADRPGLSWCRW